MLYKINLEDLVNIAKQADESSDIIFKYIKNNYIKY